MGKHFKISNENNYNVSTRSPVNFLLCDWVRMMSTGLTFY